MDWSNNLVILVPIVKRLLPCKSYLMFMKVASLMLWSEVSEWFDMQTQWWPSQSSKESMLNCLLIEQQPFV